MIPLLAAVVLDEDIVGRAQMLGKGVRPPHRRASAAARGSSTRASCGASPASERLLLGVVGIERLVRLFEKLFDEREFLSPHGLRALSAYHRDHPYVIEVEGMTATVDYEPAESTTDMFGGNSNWRGPIWFPLNYLVVNTLERYYRFFGDELHHRVPDRHRPAPLARLRRRGPPAAAGRPLRAWAPDGRRPCFGGVERLQRDPAWKDNLVFSEYFHGDNGAGLGASHQTGWTGIVADLIRGRPGNGVYTLGEAPRLAARAGLVVTRGRRATPCACARAGGAPLGATPSRAAAPTSRWRRASPTGCVLCLFDDEGRETQVPLATTTPASGTASSPASARARPTATARWARSTPRAGMRCNPAKLLLDPYARAIDRCGHVRTRGPRPRPRRPRTCPARSTRPRHVPAQPGRRPGVRLGRRRPPHRTATPTRSSTRSTSRASR